MSGGVLVAVFCVLVACGDNATLEPDRDAAPLPPTPMLDAPATVTIVEGERRTFVVKLVEEPREDVSITVSSRDPAAAIVETSSFTLTSATYATSVEVAVRGVEDDDDVINESVELVLALDDVVQARIVATVMDNDIQQLVVDPPTLTIAEAASGELTVRLARVPEAPVAVTLWSSAPGVATPTPAMLTFGPSDFAVPQRVSVSVPADANAADETATIYVRDLAATEPDHVEIAVTDDDTQALLVSAGDVPIVEGATASFTVALAYDPVTPLTLALDSSDPSALQLSSTWVTFDSTNYDVPQTITLAAAEDADRLHEATTVTVSGALAQTITVPITDDDDILVTGDTTIAEGRLGTMRVSLGNDPGPSGRTVTLDVIAGDVTPLASTLTFTSANYSGEQEVLVYAAVDAGVTNTTAVVRVSYAGYPPQDVPLTIIQRADAGTLRSLWFWEENASAGALGWLQAFFEIDSTWPGDGRLVITFPPGYDASAATLLDADVDGSLAVATATTSSVTLVRASGTTFYWGQRKRVRLGAIRNPAVSGDYPISVETQRANGSSLDRRTERHHVATAPMIDASLAFATLAPAATGSVTVTFTTRNPWPADGYLEVWFPSEFGVAAATVAGQADLDGTLVASSPAPDRVRVTRAGGTTLPAGSAVSLVIGNITNPPTSRVTTDFVVITATATGAFIDGAQPPGVTIGPTLTRSAP